MGLFSKNKKNADVMAIRLGNDGLYAASVRFQTGGLPAVEFLSFYPKSDQAWPVLLERLARETPAKQKQCLLQLNSNEYQWFAIDALNVPADELKNALIWRLKELIDYPIESASFDVLTVPGDIHNGGRNQSLIVIVAANQQLIANQNLFVNAKLPLRLIDVPEMAQRNISARLEIEGRGLAMLSFDAQGGLLTVTYGGELYLSRRLDISTKDLDSQNLQERDASFERISLELQRSLDHFDRQHNYITTAKLVVAPLGEAATFLQQYLSSNMYLPVEILDLAQLVNIDKIPELKSAERQRVFLSVIGAALRQEAGTA
ncbi:agglutinin biogenesis protein MshI [Undibacterium amnicola]|uniref:Agglutinin biogenesis protein MshI n=1 Tax=Undibacterium amnicola TaxID=1834038 RepID=A0ABR6XN58_9BURK|nr:agglutinin biogenesis protein MshI [Undibacterium amnicola]MBC3830914.1 agglutinin biogenesis protein MshI [Undibacterium amnicola]